LASWQAVKFAAAGFLVPFVFVYYPALLFQGECSEIVLALVTGGAGVVALAAGLEGYFLRVATWPERHPGVVTDLVGLALLAVGVGLQPMRPAVAAVAGVSR
jgi:TRAP-type uncharacterized transport system fused permease subunit